MTPEMNDQPSTYMRPGEAIALRRTVSARQRDWRFDVEAEPDGQTPIGIDGSRRARLAAWHGERFIGFVSPNSALAKEPNDASHIL